MNAKAKNIWILLLVTLIGLSFCFAVSTAAASTKAEIDKKVAIALNDLLARSPAARSLRPDAKGIMVFPNIVKGALFFGGHYGEGALLSNDRTLGYYNTVAASYGLQAGVQSFGYALFLMTDEALEYLNKSAGWEIGVGPTVVIINEGISKNLTTTTAHADVYGFFFDQNGLMAGISLQGSKISRIHPE